MPSSVSCCSVLSYSFWELARQVWRSEAIFDCLFGEEAVSAQFEFRVEYISMTQNSIIVLVHSLTDQSELLVCSGKLRGMDRSFPTLHHVCKDVNTNAEQLIFFLRPLLKLLFFSLAPFPLLPIRRSNSCKVAAATWCGRLWLHQCQLHWCKPHSFLCWHQRAVLRNVFMQAQRWFCTASHFKLVP